MGYNNQELQKVLNYCRQCGDLKLIRDILVAAKSGQSLQYTIKTFSEKDAARKQRNIYKVLWFYPEIKPWVSTRLKGQDLIISIGMKIEKRGRRKIL
jgi:hypothetical protein